MSSNPEKDPSVPPDLPEPGNPEPPVTPTEGDALEAELAALKADLIASRDAQLRALAEMDNVRRRAQRDIEAAHRFGIERFARDMIEVRETLELGIAAAGQSTEAVQVVEGMTATLRLLDKGFERAGLAVLDPLGQRFNPEFHEAMVTQPSADHPPGTVLAVVQKGFTLNGRLLRPARVVVARAPDTTN
jgi:molecular chaperone GrpE